MCESCSADTSIPTLLINHKLCSYSTNGALEELNDYYRITQLEDRVL